MSIELQNLLGDHSQGPLIHVPKSVAAKQFNVKVEREGELVALTINGTKMLMPWRAAMQIGQWLMAKGAEAKVQAGEMKFGR
jgi:hypothetical protein